MPSSYQRYQLKMLRESRAAYKALMEVYPLTLDDLDGEIWRDFVAEYQISNFGRMKSFRRRQPQILKPQLLEHYMCFDTRNSVGQRIIVHRAVAQAFLPNPEGKPQVNHIDSNKLNNHVSNLEWCTQSENIQHSLMFGRKKSGEDNYLASMSNELVRWLRSVYIPRDPEFGGAALARKLGKSESAVKFALQGNHYRLI